MKRINSTEMRGLLEPELLKGSCYDPDSTAYLTNSSTNNSQTLKHSESSSTLRSTHNDLSLIEERFQALQEDYSKLLQQTKRKREIFLKQRSQLQKYKINHQKDRKQIERLQSLINMAKKTDIISKKSNSQSIQSSIILTKQKNSSSMPKFKKLIQTNKQSQKTDFFISKETNYGLRKIGRKQQSEIQLSRYKFVPSVCLN